MVKLPSLPGPLCGGVIADYPPTMRIALYQPEIAQNVGAVLRLGACMGVAVDLIEPMGFEWDDKRVRRTAMDYIDAVDIARHTDFSAFRAASPARLILLSTKGDDSPYDFRFEATDRLLLGRQVLQEESSGLPGFSAHSVQSRMSRRGRTAQAD